MPSPERLRRTFPSLLTGQLQTVAFAIQREGAIAVAALAGVCILTVTTALRFHERLDAIPELLFAALPIALLLPWAVWRGDSVFGRPLLWTLPVRRQHAAVARIAAGALWLMLAVLLGLVALMLTARATGGSIGFSGTRLVGPFSAGFEGAAPVPWRTPAWMWLVPFGSALLVYLAGSALLLGLRHPLRWIAGTAVAAILLGVLAANLGPESALENAGEGVFEFVVEARYGLDVALTGGLASLSEDVAAPGGRSAELWRALPDAGRWAAALALWLGGTLIALALALRRHWER